MYIITSAAKGRSVRIPNLSIRDSLIFCFVHLRYSNFIKGAIMRWKVVLVLAILFIAAFCHFDSVFADLNGGEDTGSDLYRNNPYSGSWEIITHSLPHRTGGLAYVPISISIILGSIGLTLSGWLLKRKRMV